MADGAVSAASAGTSSSTSSASATAGVDGPWLHAWYDPVAGLKTFSQCIRLADLSADKDYRLIVADQDRRMKVYRGTGVASVHSLLDMPVALATFHSDLTLPRTPSVAVAAGPFVFIYRNLRPYLKFTLPQIPISSAETEIWAALWATKIDAAEAAVRLASARDTNRSVALSSRALDLIAITDEKERTDFLATVKDKPLVQQTVVSCMDSINREREGDGELSSLVLGTESKQLLILDASGSAIEHAIALPSVATHIAMNGLLNVEYRINVACRDAVVYAVKGGQLMATKIECGSLPCGIVRTEAELYIATMDSKLHSFHVKGKKNWTVSLPSPVTAMCNMLVRRTKVSDCCAVACEGGEVRVYNGKSCVATLMAQDTITAMRFGQYGREANTLALVSRSGALTFKMIRRSAEFDAIETPAGPPPEQDIPLPVPKKTKLYVEQTQRERDQAMEMHRIFQRDLCKLRLTAARAFVKTISDGGSALATLTGASLRLNAAVMGLGPAFKITIDLTNVGSQPAFDVALHFAYNPAAYTMPRCYHLIPFLVPGLRYRFEFAVSCLLVSGGSDVIRCVVTRGAHPIPSINAVITMPLSQPIMA